MSLISKHENRDQPHTMAAGHVSQAKSKTDSQAAAVVVQQYLKHKKNTGDKASPIQRQVPEEEIAQGKFPVQKQEDEDLMQGKFPIQRQEDEDLMQGKFSIQRQEDEDLMQGKFPIQREPEAPSASSASGIPESVQSSMENSLKTDLSDVKVHANSSKATEVGALAYTQGTDIHMAPGHYNPGTSSGKQLLGHELAHVAQQKEGRVQPTGEVGGLPLNDSPSLEKEADSLASKVK